MSIVPLAVSAAGLPTEATSDLRPLIESLRDEVRTLSYQIEELRQHSAAGEPTPRTASPGPSATEKLRTMVAQAVADAMRDQHDTNRREMADLRLALATHADRIEEAQRSGTSILDSDKIVRQFDARFAWLVNELSARFVLLGNELVRIEQQLTPGTKDTPPTNGHVERSSLSNTDGP